MNADARDAHQNAKAVQRQSVLLAVSSEVHAAILTSSVVYPSRKKGAGLRVVAWKTERRAGLNGDMSRKSKPLRPVPYGQPHHWAYLGEWRDTHGLTQENIAGTLSVTGVTVHRWETGKAAVSGANLAKLAGIYGLTDVGMLSLPPAKKDDIAAIREAWKIIAGMSPESRSEWLSHGRILRTVADAEKKTTS